LIFISPVSALDFGTPQAFSSQTPRISAPPDREFAPRITPVPSITSSPGVTQPPLEPKAPSPDPVPTQTEPGEPAQKPGDINKDGVVDLQDYQVLKNSFKNGNLESDINSDGAVNILDYIILSNNFNKGT
jgi:hypothetical protein